MCGTAAGDRPPLLALLRVSGGVAGPVTTALRAPCGKILHKESVITSSVFAPPSRAKLGRAGVRSTIFIFLIRRSSDLLPGAASHLTRISENRFPDLQYIMSLKCR